MPASSASRGPRTRNSIRTLPTRNVPLRPPSIHTRQRASTHPLPSTDPLSTSHRPQCRLIRVIFDRMESLVTTSMQRAPLKVICEIDASRASEERIEAALAYGSEHDAEITFVWVFDPRAFGSTSPVAAGGPGALGTAPDPRSC